MSCKTKSSRIIGVEDLIKPKHKSKKNSKSSKSNKGNETYNKITKYIK